MKKYVYKNILIRAAFGVLDAVGYLLEFILSVFRKKASADPQRILIIKLDHAGDLLLAFPAIKAIRKKYPSAHITLVTGTWSRGIVEGETFFNDLISVKAYWHDRSPDRTLNLKEYFQLIKILRSRRYDMFFDLRGDLFAIIIGFLSGIPRRIGFGWSGGGFLLTDEIAATIKKHQVEILMDAVRIVDPQAETQRLSKNISAHDDRQMSMMMREEGLDESRILIGFHIGSGCPSKMWPLPRFADLMRRVYGSLNAQIVIVGGPEDLELVKRLKGLLSFKPIVMAGRASFGQTAAVIKKCALFIGNDSVPAHIAAAVEVPVVVLFSAANDPRRWRPFGNDVNVICKDVQCRGCEKGVCGSMECMNLTTVDEVFHLVSGKINASAVRGFAGGV